MKTIRKLLDRLKGKSPSPRPLKTEINNNKPTCNHYYKKYCLNNAEKIAGTTFEKWKESRYAR